MQKADDPPIMKDVPPSPSTSDEFADNPVGLIVHPEKGKQKGTERVHFRVIPTRSCVVMTAAIFIVFAILGMSIYLVVAGIGDTTFAYGAIGSTLSVGLIYLKPASVKSLTQKPETAAKNV